VPRQELVTDRSESLGVIHQRGKIDMTTDGVGVQSCYYWE